MVISVLSGKGGTGKTTVVAALSELAQEVIKVDCDVDAPNLYLFYKGVDVEKKDFYGGKKAEINKNLCFECEICEEVCKFGAITNWVVDPFACEGCGACTIVCPQNAISLVEEKTADTFLTKTDKGIISRAMMGVGSDGSGKLVTYLRKNVKHFEEDNGITIIDGSPGIGCSVIASITETDVVLIVTEPTKSGLDDLKRILVLAERFETQVMICINKYDINLEMASQIEAYAKEKNLFVVGKIPFDKKVMESVNTLRPITEFENSSARKAIEAMWIQMNRVMNEK
ncbi:ATP-binding protein [[Clostridium] fimetarium]|uniref:MinD superfamily P-loop ATPase, contains an inserted ferredoxin domain n=1 Tax=[Clostridium] fimetarium TaxID=99656 RepID=A0A1I0RTR3_9FIRM|nr:ATP-binding protein [[Clostridium] fimetarium]SEW44726.1 MinD superfamily P-loop ATPase, contains an inserted ferredoxin domain [[Clostridium] fimetarium]